MQPHTAMWKPNPQPSRTNVMTGAVGCGRTDESREACAFIENDDASTPQARTNDNLLNMDKTSLLTVSLVVLWKWKHTPTILSQHHSEAEGAGRQLDESKPGMNHARHDGFSTLKRRSPDGGCQGFFRSSIRRER
jgi:hypothetical protein